MDYLLFFIEIQLFLLYVHVYMLLHLKLLLHIYIFYVSTLRYVLLVTNNKYM